MRQLAIFGLGLAGGFFMGLAVLGNEVLRTGIQTVAMPYVYGFLFVGVVCSIVGICLLPPLRQTK